jgi:hypothetical protein
MAFDGGLAASDVVRSELTALGEDGPFKLTVVHSHGTIVEYFADMTVALRRQGEIEALLAAARCL